MIDSSPPPAAPRYAAERHVPANEIARCLEKAELRQLIAARTGSDDAGLGRDRPLRAMDRPWFAAYHHSRADACRSNMLEGELTGQTFGFFFKVSFASFAAWPGQCRRAGCCRYHRTCPRSLPPPPPRRSTTPPATSARGRTASATTPRRGSCRTAPSRPITPISRCGTRRGSRGGPARTKAGPGGCRCPSTLTALPAVTTVLVLLVVQLLLPHHHCYYNYPSY
jgi:hypothetical protein